MTVAELIAELQKLPQDLVVVNSSIEDWPSECAVDVRKTKYWTDRIELKEAEVAYLG